MDFTVQIDTDIYLYKIVKRLQKTSQTSRQNDYLHANFGTSAPRNFLILEVLLFLLTGQESILGEPREVNVGP